MAIQQRLIKLQDGKISSLKLDAPTWVSLDLLAKETGKTWQEWVFNATKNIKPTDNFTACVREAVAHSLLYRTFELKRADDNELMSSHSFMKNHGILNDEELAEELKGATIQGRSEFGGFTIQFGQTLEGVDCLWILNEIRGGMHVMFVTN